MSRIVVLLVSAVMTGSVALATSPPSIDGQAVAKCSGSAKCKTCTNCTRCGHCKAGGTCGVCKQPTHVH